MQRRGPRGTEECCSSYDQETDKCVCHRHWLQSAKEFSLSFCSCCWIIISWEELFELKRAWFLNRSHNIATVHHQPSAILSSLGELFEEVRGGGIVGVGGGIVVISGDSGGVLLDGADLANNNHRAYQKGGPLPPSSALLNGGKMAADAGSDTCPSPEIGDSRKRPLEGDTTIDNGSTKRSHYSTITNNNSSTSSTIMNATTNAVGKFHLNPLSKQKSILPLSLSVCLYLSLSCHSTLSSPP